MRTIGPVDALMKKTGIGLIFGILISAGILAALALWPIADEIRISPPDQPPIIPPAPTISDHSGSMIPQPALPQEKPADSGTLPSPAEPAEASGENKPSGEPKHETKRPEEPRKTKPVPPYAAESTSPETVKPSAETPVSNASPTIGQSDLDGINSLLNRLKSIYLGKDIETIEKLIILSADQEASLRKIFNSYKNIQADLEEMKITGDRVTSAIVIRSLENETGNAVIPGPIWGKQSLTITAINNQWNQVALTGNPFKNAQKRPADLIAPMIVHTLPTYTAKPGTPAEISATITDNSKIAQAELHFRAQGDRNYETTGMSEGPGHTYSGRIPGSMIKTNSTSMEYYIEAKDMEGNVSIEGRPTVPLVIAVVPPSSK